jgi:deoxyadenosine/deoxycytidine kinase
MNLKNQYHNFFKNTKYLVYFNNSSFAIEIDKNNKWLDDILQKNNGWAFITAYNPLPEILTGEENKKRNKDLESQIKKSGYKYFKAVGKGENNWEEESFLIINITKEHAMELGKKYSQLAILYGKKHETAGIIYL